MSHGGVVKPSTSFKLNDDSVFFNGESLGGEDIN